MAGIEQAADDLFFKLRNRFPKITLGDEDGNSTTNPKEARFFNFDFEENEIKFGNVTASLIDKQNLKVYFSQDITKYMDAEEKKVWYDFLRELRKFAKSRLLGLDVRDITKDILTHEDLKFVSNQHKEKSQIGESKILWARRGKVSEGNLNSVKIHVVHSERMIENTNNRLLKVDRIFLVNESGERFLLPFKSVMAAKAMANHVGRGGTPYDNSGRLISDAVMEMSNLRRFATATRRKTFESEDAVHVIEAAASIKESIKRSLFRMANNSRFDENMEDLGKIMAEQTDIEDIKPMFVQSIYNENLDNWINSAAKAYKQYKGNIMEALKESAGTVAAKLKDPSWKMVLKDDPAEDRLIASSKYVDGKALLRRVLGTVADRIGMDDSEIANWASQIGQDLEDGKASREDMQIALQLAKRYQDDLKQILSNPEVGKDLRVSAFGKKKDLYGKVKDESTEFESFVNGIGEGDEADMMDDITADEEGMGQMKVNEIEVEETPMDRIRERASSREVTSTPAERVAERVVARTGGTTAAERVAERVSARHPMTKVAERVAARAGQGEEVVAEIDDEMDEAIPGTFIEPSDDAKDQANAVFQKDADAAVVGRAKMGIKDVEEGDMEEGNEFSGALAKAKASNQDEFEVNGKSYTVKEAEMSRAAKGYEKYGKQGMQALAKAGKEGKDLDKIRDKYNKYDDNVDEGREVNPFNDSLALMRKLAGLR